jgi:hypothetical protein
MTFGAIILHWETKNSPNKHMLNITYHATAKFVLARISGG